jgi:hypothetical protein
VIFFRHTKMNPLFKVVAITLLSAHPDRFRQCLSVSASGNAKPPAGISLLQLIRAVEQRGAHLLKQLIIQEELQQKQQENSTTTDGGNNSSSSNQRNKDNNQNSNFDADESELMNADAQNENEDEDGDENQTQDELDRRAAQQRGRAARFKQIWPQNVLPDIWVPDVVKSLMSMGAIVNENAGIENRRPNLRLTQAAFNAAWNELSGMRFEKGANTIIPTELQRRTNKNKYERTKRKKTQQKKAKRATGDNKAVIMEKKMAKIRGKVNGGKNKKKKVGKVGGGGKARAGKKRSN